MGSGLWSESFRRLFVVISRVLVDSGKSHDLWLYWGVSTPFRTRSIPVTKSKRALFKQNTGCSSEWVQWGSVYRGKWQAGHGLLSADWGPGKLREVRLLRNFPFTNHGWNKVLSIVFQGRDGGFFFFFGFCLFFWLWKVPRIKHCNSEDKNSGSSLPLLQRLISLLPKPPDYSRLHFNSISTT